MKHFKTSWILAVATMPALVGLTAGCAGRPALFPNSDPALRRTSAEFAADAAKRQPFKADAPSGGDAIGRAEVEYGLKELRILDSSDEDWNNVEVWVNQKYVVFIPKIQRHKLETIKFPMLYDANGHSFPTSFSHGSIKQVNVYHDGKMFNLPVHLAE